MKESLKAELPLDAEEMPEAMSRVMDAWLRRETSRRRFRSWLTPDLLPVDLLLVDLLLSLLSLLFLPFWALLILRLALLPKMLKSWIL